MTNAQLKRRLARALDQRDAAKLKLDMAEVKLSEAIRAYCDAHRLTFLRPENARLIVQKEERAA